MPEREAEPDPPAGQPSAPAGPASFPSTTVLCWVGARGVLTGGRTAILQALLCYHQRRRKVAGRVQRKPGSSEASCPHGGHTGRVSLAPTEPVMAHRGVSTREAPQRPGTRGFRWRLVTQPPSAWHLPRAQLPEGQQASGVDHPAAQPAHNRPRALQGPAGALLSGRLPHAPAETCQASPGAAGFHGEPFGTMSLFRFSAVPVAFLHCDEQ